MKGEKLKGTIPVLRIHCPEPPTIPGRSFGNNISAEEPGLEMWEDDRPGVLISYKGVTTRVAASTITYGHYFNGSAWVDPEKK